MEGNIRHFPERSFKAQKKWEQQRLVRRGVATLVLMVALALLPFSQGTKTLGKESSRLIATALSKLGAFFILEDVQWEESGSSNLSYHLKRAALWQASGLRLRQSMLEIDLEELEKKLMSIPWIESVRIQKKLPSTLLVQYSIHNARALGLRGRQIWLISSEGAWVAPVDDKDAQDVDLPFLTEGTDPAKGLEWLDLLDQELKPDLLQIHQVSISEKDSRLNAIVELRYASKSVKLALVAWAQPQQEALTRLKRVVQYLIKNNILVSSVDLRGGQKVVVNVGERL